MKPHIGSEVNLLSSYLPWGVNVWLHSSVGRASHRYRRGHGFKSRWSLDFFRLLLSSCLNWKIYCDDHSSLRSTTAVQIYELFHIYFTSFHSSREIWTQLIDLAPNVWLHSSVGRASHRYRRGHGFKSRWSLDFFRLLLSSCLNWKIYCDDHSSFRPLNNVKQGLFWPQSERCYSFSKEPKAGHYIPCLFH